MKASRQKTRQLEQLITSAARVLGVPVCMNDDMDYSGLPLRLRIHSNPACMAVKKDHIRECVGYCRCEMDRQIANKTEGMVATCPFGHVQVVAPIHIEGMFIATLFAGPFKTPKVAVKSNRFIQACRPVVAALARDISAILSAGPNTDRAGNTRRREILKFISQNLSEPISREALARQLSLSPSRTSHVVRKIFHKSLSELTTDVRMTRAARYLAAGDMPLVELAQELGYCDQSHFSRTFKKHFGIAPLAYRNKYHTEPDEPPI